MYTKDIFKEGEKILFSVVEEDAQIMAERVIGRKLTEDELERIADWIEESLSETLSIVLKDAIRVECQQDAPSSADTKLDGKKGG